MDSQSTQTLPAGTRLEEFEIQSVLGSGGFGITYLAQDTRLDRQVVIKENLPVQFCFRDTHSLTVAPRHTHGDDLKNFRWSLENFSKEAAMLASLDHPGIVKVLRSFEAFGTAYFVMPFVEGVALDELMKQRDGNPFSEEELRGLLERMLDALGYLHDRGIYHRDIKPGNILITNDGLPVLIDFGSARQRLSERSLTVVESAGYTPFEQLQSRGNVGPWSDVYALGGTLVKVMTGETPPKAMDRMRNDPYRPLAGRAELKRNFCSKFLGSIDKALAVDESDRCQNGGEWIDLLFEVEKEVPIAVMEPRRQTTSQPVRKFSQNADDAEENFWSRKELQVLPSAGDSTEAGVNQELKGPAIYVIAITVAVFLGAWVSNEIEALQDTDEALATATPGLNERNTSQRTIEGSKAGEEKEFEIAPGVKMVFCWCPAGEFVMGSPPDELGRESDEKQVEVTLSKGFWLAKTEVTQGQWKAAGGIDVSGRPPSFLDGKVQATWEQFSASGISPVNFKGDKLPVERVDWNESRDWCSGLTERLRNDGQLSEGWKLALPTEVQWEYACRAGTTTALHSGRNLTSKGGVCANLGDVGWYDQNSVNGIQPAGEKKANAWGLYDMHGNVWEWCADWFGAELADGVDPLGVASGVHSALRGGSWSVTASRCRAAGRHRLLPGGRFIILGFRPALVPSE